MTTIIGQKYTSIIVAVIIIISVGQFSWQSYFVFREHNDAQLRHMTRLRDNFFLEDPSNKNDNHGNARNDDVEKGRLFVHCHNSSHGPLTSGEYTLPPNFPSSAPNFIRLPARILTNDVADANTVSDIRALNVSHTGTIEIFSGWPTIFDNSTSCLAKIERVEELFKSADIRSSFFSKQATKRHKRDLCMLSQVFVDGGIFLDRHRALPGIEKMTIGLLDQLAKGVDVVSIVSDDYQLVLGAPPGHPLIQRSLELMRNIINNNIQLKSGNNLSAVDAVKLAMQEIYHVKNVDANDQTMLCKGVYYLPYGNEHATTSENGVSVSEAAKEALRVHLQVKRSKLPREDTWLLEDTHKRQHHENVTKQIPRLITKIYIQKDGHFMDYREAPRLRIAQESWTKMNPGYELRLFNLVTARKYLRDYFHPTFLRAFDCLQPFAAKSDFFRYLVLYREGGWYSDWKQECLKENVLAEISRDTDFYAVRDNGNPYSIKKKCVQTSFIGVTPRHPIMTQSIEIVLKHIQERYYGEHCLDTTGPCALGLAIINAEKKYGLKYSLSDGLFKVAPKPKTYFFRKNEKIIRHKCDGCGGTHLQNWEHGNSYVRMWDLKQNYYCEDAESIFD
mmetsp:Transcript_10818/g.22632  ORF Transcript_10818/g.22632 Transcript_10818/m.22632 type:complete len:617 (-) Transcript_10818:530-2380(-)